MRVKEKSEKADLKLNIQKTKIMISSLTTSWQMGGGNGGAMTDFIFLGSKTTEDSACSHEIKRHLLLGRKAMTKLGSIWKSRDMSLPTRIHLVKAVVFPVVMFGCESWTIKKDDCRRIDAFELWWRRLLSPLDSKEIQPVNPRRNQPRIFIRRTDTEAPILWPPDVKCWFTGKDSDAGKAWRQKGNKAEEV